MLREQLNGRIVKRHHATMVHYVIIKKVLGVVVFTIPPTTFVLHANEIVKAIATFFLKVMKHFLYKKKRITLVHTQRLIPPLFCTQSLTDVELPLPASISRDHNTAVVQNSNSKMQEKC